MSLQQSFSRFRKKAKDKLPQIGKKGGESRTDIGHEGANLSTLSLQSEPAIVVESELGGDASVGVGNSDPLPDGSPSFSRSAVEIACSQGGSSIKADEGETSQKDLHPHSHVQTESQSSQERGDVDAEGTVQVNPPARSESHGGDTATPTPSISQAGGYDST